ncbi:hypothetical protein GCM10022403_071950 [Streptomyces coacervatus]|uniref:HTH tetR-type domain-containing protein n=1 Tax=Streptomyces coacervatus TaxID=647381 RepID=A0ABP7IVW8_9ACTN|nr:TetR/AcrR family transcriptional regulator [Streptomyces coacervatus]MDF2269682.1 TetR/AcrR family transcriptional regulator [Streptomyces coacervatus]
MEAIAGPDDIALRAGVGNATLYRYFPTRDALLDAVYSADIEALTGAARELLETTENGQALRAWLRLVIEHLTARRGLTSASLNTAGDSQNLNCHWHDPMEATVTELLADAREDVGATELLMVANTIATAAEFSPGAAERLLDLTLDGITPR